MEEVWKDIDGFQGCYQVSNLGNVRSIDRYVRCGENGIKLQLGKSIKQSKNKYGYMQVRLSNGRKNKFSYTVHRLVAIAFIPNDNNYDQVNHIDGNKQNNYVENLEWCNNSYNQIHAYKTGLQDRNKYYAGRKRRKVAKLSKDLRILDIYETVTQAAKENGIYESYVDRVCLKQRETSYGYKWCFANEDMKVGDVVDEY